MASIKYIDCEKNMIFILGLPGKARLMLNIVFHTIRYIVIYISRRMVLIIPHCNAALFFTYHCNECEEYADTLS